MADNENPIFHIEDEAWTDRLDSRTGAVFYVSPTSSAGQNTSGRPWSSHQRSLSVGDLASYSTCSPRRSADDGEQPEEEILLNSTQSRGARKHMFARMYDSLKRKATRSSSHERQSNPATVPCNITSSANLPAEGEGPCLRTVLPPLRLQTKVVHPRACIEGMSSTLMQFVKGQSSESRYRWKQYGHLYHAVLYLTLDVGEEISDDSKDVLFQCPKVIGCQLSQLLKLKGVFITLNDVMKQIAGTSSSITTVYIQDQLVHVGCSQYGQEALVVALAAEPVSYQQVQCVVEETERLLVYMYGSVSRAFSSTEHHPALHRMFMLMFERLLGSTLLNEGPSLDHTHAASPAMRVSEMLQAVLERELSSFEVFVSESLSLSSIGGVKAATSALFYKGHVVRSQLTREDLTGVTLFLRAHCLLCLTSVQRVQQIVIWRELASEAGRSGSQTSLGQGRKFLLVVGLKNGILCIVCHSQHLPEVALSPDPLIVDRGRTLLLRMDAKGVFSACERSNAENTPQVCSLDDQPVVTVAKQRRWGKHPSFHSRSNGGANHDDEASLRGRGGTQSNASPKQSRMKSEKQSPSSAQLEGLLLHYVSINSLTGTVVTPCSHLGQDGAVSPWSVGGPLHREMLMQFDSTCLALRQALYNPQQEVREQGVLYECSTRGYTEKGKLVELTGSYWIVGRRVDEEREVYVCVADSVPPDLTELAFLLHL